MFYRQVNCLTENLRGIMFHATNDPFCKIAIFGENMIKRLAKKIIIINRVSAIR